MSLSVINIISGAYQLLGRPSQQDLPYKDLLEHASDVINGRLIDMQLTARQKSLSVSRWFTPSAQTKAASDVADTDWIIPTRIEWQPVDADATYTPGTVELVAYDQLSDAYSKYPEKVYAAIYDDPDAETQIVFPDSVATLATRSYRIAYEGFDKPPATFGAGYLKDIFLPLCKYETAIRALDQVENASDVWADKRERLRGSLTPIFLKEQQRFENHNRLKYGNRVIAKQGFRTRFGAAR